MIRRFLNTVYTKAQEHEFSLRFLLMLKRISLPRKVNYLMTCWENQKLRKCPSDDMLKSQLFYLENWPRVKNILAILEDEISRRTLGGVLRYRTMRTPIPRELCLIKDQYFVDDILRVEEGEVFVDVGAYVGDTIGPLLSQAERKNVHLGKVVAFEPGELNYKLLVDTYGSVPNVVLLKKGVSDEDATKYFVGSGINGKISSETESVGEAITVVRLDSEPACRDATWIKMDIEGAEMSALRGAQELITKNHPKLTICIYHSDEDMVRIAEYIHELVPAYKLYIRHHTRMRNETVLYAVP